LRFACLYRHSLKHSNTDSDNDMSVFTDKEIEELKDTFNMCDLNQDVRLFFSR
jgi:Ca2+-binding EF-hand superfamily protein